MNKCEWKEGEFKGCESVLKVAPYRMSSEEVKKYGTSSIFMGQEIFFCPFCGADIRKPEPEVIIRKSGGTYSALISNKHCLCIMPDVYEHLKGKVTPERMLEDGIFKPISEIEITDEIAKLRPMVKCTCGCGKMFPLLAVVDQDYEVCRFVGSDEGTYTAWVSVRLATVSDLEEK